MGRPGVGGEAPLPRQVGVQRVAVDEDQRRAVEQPGDQRVPHHPGGRGEPEHPVAGLHVPGQAVVLEVLDGDPAVAVHDRLGRPGRARREQHHQRVVERHRVVGRRRRGPDQLRPRHRVRDRAGAVGHGDDVAHAREGRAQRRDLGAAIDGLVAVDVAGDGDQHRRLDLGEAVDHAARPELRRARGPHRAEARGGEVRDHRLGDVRGVGDHAVPASHAEAHQAGPGAGDGVAQLAAGPLLGLAGLGVGEQGDVVVGLGPLDGALRVVQRRPREPHGARHPAALEHRAGLLVERDRVEPADRRPEAVEVGDRPALQGVVVVEHQPALGRRASRRSGR